MYVLPYQSVLLDLTDILLRPSLRIPSLSILLRARLAIWFCLSLLLLVATVWYDVRITNVLNSIPPVVPVSLASSCGSGDLDVSHDS